ncbi:MAG TPA: Swt1 family HEPN domain-containing protein [Bacteroidia bacterium]|nr:Swt1 family HEPN domain-containing protein [Bacteroidia bacterium]
MLETDLIKLEKSGIDIQHIDTISQQDIVDIELFEHRILASARKMARFYVYYFAFENSIRSLISGRLEEKYGINWWELKAPPNIQKTAGDHQTKERETAMAIRSDEPLYYTTFGELIDIINYNWDDFSDTIRSKKSMELVLSQFSKIRNVIAHSCELEEDDIFRLKLLIKDWFRIQT